MAAIHRTAVFTIHQPTRHVRAVLERAFRDYTAAYTEMLHAVRKRYDVDALRGLASYTLPSGAVRQSAQQLKNRLYQDAEIAKTLTGVTAPLEGRLRQSVREHVAQTLMSYIALSDAQSQDARRGGAPDFPQRLRAGDVERVRTQALREIAILADNRARERAVVARLQQTRQSAVVAIPFVGVNPRYGCGLYYNGATRTFYARLDVVANGSRHGRPVALWGTYVDVKTGVRYHSTSPSTGSPEVGCNEVGCNEEDTASFGRSTKSIFVPLEMGRWHESRLRFTASAFLPQRGTDMTQPTPAVPVAAKLVRKVARGAAAENPRAVRYELHVAFEMPAPLAADGLDEATRPLLAFNRGIHQLVAGVLTTPDARTITQTFASSGRDLRALQEARERVRRARAQRGAHVPAGDRRQSRMAEHHVHLLANQIVEMAAEHRAQVVMEDLTSFATGHALRDNKSVQPAARRVALRTILNRRQFQAVIAAVDARLQLVGLPPVRVVGAAYISQTCSQCGTCDASARDAIDPRVFRCPQCGVSGDLDVIAAANIARKLLWLRRRGAEKRAGMSEDERTSWAVFARTVPIVVRLPTTEG